MIIISGMRRVLFPILYTALLGPVVIAVGVIVIITEKTVGLHAIKWMGDVDASLALLVIGGLVFYGGNMFLQGLEREACRGFKDHVRRCLLLYLLACSGGLFLLGPCHGGGLGCGGIALVAMSAAYGIVINLATMPCRIFSTNTSGDSLS